MRKLSVKEMEDYVMLSDAKIVKQRDKSRKRPSHPSSSVYENKRSRMEDWIRMNALCRTYPEYNFF